MYSTGIAVPDGLTVPGAEVPVLNSIPPAVVVLNHMPTASLLEDEMRLLGRLIADVVPLKVPAVAGDPAIPLAWPRVTLTRVAFLVPSFTATLSPALAAPGVSLRRQYAVG